MILTFRPIDQWPEGWRDPDRKRRPSPFESGYQQTLTALDKELRHLRARDVFLQVDAAPGQVRNDGQLRADAKVTHPGAILTIDTPDLGVLVYPCDTFVPRGYRSSDSGWQVNLRAIALGLEALRKVERYGIADRGQQYAGFGALPPAQPMGEHGAMDPLRAARVLLEAADEPPTSIEGMDVEWARRNVDDLFKRAVKRYHPDVGGDASIFGRITLARDTLKGMGS